MSSKNNRVLINNLHKHCITNKLSNGYVYLKYVEDAEFLCEWDIVYIKKLFNYEKQWIQIKKNQLMKDVRWMK